MLFYSYMPLSGRSHLSITHVKGKCHTSVTNQSFWHPAFHLVTILLVSEKPRLKRCIPRKVQAAKGLGHLSP